VLLAVNIAEVATPLALVTAVFTPPANVPLAPVCAGAVNVTVTPETGLLPASFTVTCRVEANAGWSAGSVREGEISRSSHAGHTCRDVIGSAGDAVGGENRRSRHTTGA